MVKLRINKYIAVAALCTLALLLAGTLFIQDATETEHRSVKETMMEMAIQQEQGKTSHLSHPPPPPLPLPPALDRSSSQRPPQSPPPPPPPPAEPTKAKEYAPVTTEEQLHVVISSDCSSYQRWQTLTSFHSALAVGQRGRMTWLVSGCDGVKQRRIVTQAVQDHFQQASRRPAVHFSPDFSDMSSYGGKYANGTVKRTFLNRHGKLVRSPYGNKYKFNNKPNAVRHWAESWPSSSSSSSSSSGGLFADEAMVLIDPDFMFMAPLRLPEGVAVTAGSPAAQRYGLGAQWVTFDTAAICGAGTPCTKVSETEVNRHYSAGPPYIVHAADVPRLASEWSRLVPPTYDQYPMLYAEMFAYSIAAVQFNLRHHLLSGLMTGCMVAWPKAVTGGSGGGGKVAVVDREALLLSADAFVEETQREAEADDANNNNNNNNNNNKIKINNKINENSKNNNQNSKINNNAEQTPSMTPSNASSRPADQPASGRGKQRAWAGGAAACFKGQSRPPPLLHYCQHYASRAFGRGIAKRQVPHDILACDATSPDHGREIQGQNENQEDRDRGRDLDRGRDQGADGDTSRSSSHRRTRQHGPLAVTAFGATVVKRGGAGGGGGGARKRDAASGQALKPEVAAWNEMAACAIFRGVAHARDEHCLLRD